jgi:hypothetical protein
VALSDPPPFRQALAATLEGLLANIGDRLRQRRPGASGAAASASRYAVDYASTWAERGAEVLALAILIFVDRAADEAGAARARAFGAGARATWRCSRRRRAAGAAPRALAARAAALSRGCRPRRRGGWRSWWPVAAGVVAARS